MVFDLALQVTPSLTAQESTASAGAINGTGVDISNIEGPVLVHVNAPVASASDTITFTVEHSEVSGSNFTAVPADVLVDPVTGDPATFTQVTDAVAVAQTLALVRDQLKRYVRIVATTAGGTIDVFFTGIIIGQKKYS